MEVETTAAELLLEKALHASNNGEDIFLLSSMAKLYSSEIANRVAKDAVQIHGACGCSAEYPLERYYRDAKITEIGEGTSEILRDIIANRVLKPGKTKDAKS
jgi:alkylation response protein AidB-like acyl-CoA dehydrogenase